jgi:hypothetical protein
MKRMVRKASFWMVCGAQNNGKDNPHWWHEASRKGLTAAIEECEHYRQKHDCYMVLARASVLFPDKRAERMFRKRARETQRRHHERDRR